MVPSRPTVQALVPPSPAFLPVLLLSFPGFSRGTWRELSSLREEQTQQSRDVACRRWTLQQKLKILQLLQQRFRSRNLGLGGNNLLNADPINSYSLLHPSPHTPNRHACVGPVHNTSWRVSGLRPTQLRNYTFSREYILQHDCMPATLRDPERETTVAGRGRERKGRDIEEEVETMGNHTMRRTRTRTVCVDRLLYRPVAQAQLQQGGAIARSPGFTSSFS